MISDNRELGAIDTVGVKSLSPVNKFSFLIDMPTLSLNTALYRYIELVFT